MKTSNKNSFGFIDFLLDIANECFFANGSSASPYDVNFTNHFNTLYDFEKEAMNEKDRSSIDKISMDKKTKSIKAEFNGVSLNRQKENAVREYCNQNNIRCDIKSGKLRSVVIDKSSNGVIDDRNWKKEL